MSDLKQKTSDFIEWVLTLESRDRRVVYLILHKLIFNGLDSEDLKQIEKMIKKLRTK